MVVLDAHCNDTPAMAAARAGLAHLEAWPTPKGRGIDSIDLDTLNMDSETHDVFGQMYGSSLYGYQLLGLTPDLAVALGFDLGDTTEYGFDDLTDAWIAVLCERLSWKAMAA